MDLVAGEGTKWEASFLRIRIIRLNFTYAIFFCSIFTGSFKYWGGFADIESELRKRTGGHPIFTAAVGPFRQAFEFVNMRRDDQ